MCSTLPPGSLFQMKSYHGIGAPSLPWRCKSPCPECQSRFLEPWKLRATLHFPCSVNLHRAEVSPDVHKTQPSPVAALILASDELQIGAYYAGGDAKAPF